MKSVQFIFGIHNHQPVGNFDFVFEEAYRKSYRPFVEVAERHPSVSLVLHFSGCLMEWLEDNHPRFLDRIRDLVGRGNVELLSGGFYEPILSVIPDHDKAGQIRKLNGYLKSRFHYRARGIWLAERVWEPHLAKSIHEAGIDYTTVDDFHFLAGGKVVEELTGYFTTEEQGYPVGVFPIHQSLRYTMPFREPEETLRILKTFATEGGDNVVVMADDGEKFGVWPGTHRRCYGRNRWMERFFAALEENGDWVKTTTFDRYSREHLPRGRVYLPNTSYFEMNEWTLPAELGERFSHLVNAYEADGELEQIRPFLRGGTWRNFLAMYDESNWIQRRMVHLSHRLAAAKGSEKGKLERARIELWRSQCNCAYWHGIFGGLYLPHLRHAVYRHLLSAEKELDRHLGGVENPTDIDGDGALEYTVRSRQVKAIVSARGGMIQELDYLPELFNLANTMRRYRESYHSRVKNAPVGLSIRNTIHGAMPAKEPGLARLLHFDRWPRKIVMDRFLRRGTGIARVKQGAPEHGDFLDGIFDVQRDGGLVLHRRGLAFGREVAVRKVYSLRGSRMAVQISVLNESSRTLPGMYACEMNFSLLGGHTRDRYYEINGKRARPKFLDISREERGVRTLGMVNEFDGFRVVLFFDKPVNLWRFPVETVSLSEGGFERVYQSSVVMPYWNLGLAPGERLNVRFALEIVRIP
ncbi:MAG: alpha-amylase/4-alpha-glucanotransferase domain-containing protein [Fidelibacterota bacterium]